MIPRPAIHLDSVARSFLLSLRLDSFFADFLLRTAIGAAAVVLIILFVSIHMPSRRRR